MSIAEKLKEWTREEEAAAVAKRDAGSGEDDTGELIPRRVSKAEIIYFASQLSVMVDTGINLAVALQGIADQTENPTLRRIIQDLRERVEGGEDFSIALSKHPKQFDRVFVSLIRASEQTGTLAEMLEQITEYLSKEVESRDESARR